MSIKAVKIMLDPGHDKAKYNRSPVVPEYYEGERMWRLYEILRPILVTKGFVVGCTKSKCDQAVEVTARGKMAKGYDCLISLHTNACDSESVNRPVGIHFVADNCGKADDTSKALAELLSKTVERVMGTTPAQQYSRKSPKDRDGNGKLDDEYYGVLHGAHQVGVPAIILENSFHTNTKAAKWLMSDSNLKKLAQALADALAEHYGVTAADTADQWYRVRKSWKDAASQLGAFRSLDNAKLACPGGYSVFDRDGKAVYSKTHAKSVDQIAQEVIQGKWGNGADRKKRLSAAGYDYDAVQKAVNKILNA